AESPLQPHRQHSDGEDKHFQKMTPKMKTTSKRATDFLSSARSYTILRHRVHSELSFLDEQSDFSAAKETAQELNSEYMRIAATDAPVPNRHFTKAAERIEQGAAD
ncbi:hypothetical protein, partial [Streptomyces erythrochromogenes]|uniref:hypothetical protein n=1 Tax=Streptomyces erythrochromogenes TaxID=285574 RepID=UPI0037F51716